MVCVWWVVVGVVWVIIGVVDWWRNDWSVWRCWWEVGIGIGVSGLSVSGLGLWGGCGFNVGEIKFSFVVVFEVVWFFFVVVWVVFSVEFCGVYGVGRFEVECIVLRDF